jgi:single-strand DNA-binding protein
MASVNKIILIGRLGKDPETSAAKGGGLMVSRISVATSDKYIDKSSNEKVERVDWHNVVLFGKSAEYICNYGKKGDSVYIEGSVRYEKYTDKNDGVEKWSTKVMGKEVKILSSKRDSDSMVDNNKSNVVNRVYNVINNEDLTDDDIPF